MIAPRMTVPKEFQSHFTHVQIRTPNVHVLSVTADCSTEHIHDLLMCYTPKIKESTSRRFTVGIWYEGHCHHGMARPQVLDGVTASSMVASREYMEQAVVNSRQGIVLLIMGGLMICTSHQILVG